MMFGNEIFIFGGIEDSKKNDLIKYSLKTNSFTKITPTNDEDDLPLARDFHASCFDGRSNTLYVIGVIQFSL